MDNTTKSNYKQTQYKRLKVSQILAEQFTGHAVKSCCKTLKSAYISIKSNNQGEHYYSGLTHCNSVWDCPHCSSVIAAGRRDEIKTALDSWRSEGGMVKLITYTVRHDKSNNLKDVQNAVNEAYRFAKAGKGYQELKKRFKVKGSIVANEVNYSEVYGWHYHRHEIVFYKSKQNFRHFEDYMYQKYKVKLALMGFSILPGIGVNVSKREGSLSGYLSKWGLENEVTSNKESNSKTPFQLLDDPNDNYLFIEYSKTMQGKRRLTWSRGMKDYFGIDNKEDSDLIEETESEQDKIIKVIDPKEWKFIIKHDLYMEVLARSYLDPAEFDTWYLQNVF